MNKIQLALVIGLSFFFQQFTNGQTNQKVNFLQKVGVLDSLYSKSLNEYREIYVQLPADYKPDENIKYPVVFVLDGEVFLPTVNDVQNYYSGGFTPEMVIVGISNDKNRMRDLTTSKVTEMYGSPFKQENGEAANFTKFIETELIPFVEHNYPVTNFRTLIGHSYGGLFALYSLVHHPQLFSNYLVIDPSLDWDNQQLIKEAKAKVSSANYKGKSLFMSLGGVVYMQRSGMTLTEIKKDTTDFTLFSRSNIDFSEVLNQNKQNELAFEWKFYPRDLHGTISFPSIMDGLISVFEWYQTENIDKYNSPTTTADEIDKIVRYRQHKLETHFGYAVPPFPEFLLNMQGYMSMDMGQMERAKVNFELTIEYYPNSANAFDSMADYYEKNGDNENAIKFVTKAFEISGEDSYKERMEALNKG
ncbi:esterase_lipase superfamily protein [Psychroflexus torquis ATCC 700755]|uniref:Esterase_lipase superfamily protein n=1 Tax=Psychroflexus torquis (strain ATCC 700755 / CIP 106069 / ACAM 623) TaxID=313595 RepID=K4IDH0_PSYTT|nr:alpha/beta hydrolase-fold protein [Psychroflexus torquis]AFU68622.1 esterase_lipase superfamily protein [Psychroflexus torquis ATCC 700755]